jgi:hypothetical protein
VCARDVDVDVVVVVASSSWVRARGVDSRRTVDGASSTASSVRARRGVARWWRWWWRWWW